MWLLRAGLMCVAFAVAAIATAEESEKPIVELAGGVLSLACPEWLAPLSKSEYESRYPGRRRPANFHATSDGRLSMYSELDRSAEGKTTEQL